MKSEEFKGVAVEAVLAGVAKAGLKRVFVIGTDQSGEIYAAGSDGTPKHLADIEAFRAALDSGDYDADEAA